jgi:hypothetical protein
MRTLLLLITLLGTAAFAEAGFPSFDLCTTPPCACGVNSCGCGEICASGQCRSVQMGFCGSDSQCGSGSCGTFVCNFNVCVASDGGAAGGGAATGGGSATGGGFAMGGAESQAVVAPKSVVAPRRAAVPQAALALAELQREAVAGPEAWAARRRQMRWWSSSRCSHCAGSASVAERTGAIGVPGEVAVRRPRGGAVEDLVDGEGHARGVTERPLHKPVASGDIRVCRHREFVGCAACLTADAEFVQARTDRSRTPREVGSRRGNPRSLRPAAALTQASP